MSEQKPSRAPGVRWWKRRRSYWRAAGVLVMTGGLWVVGVGAYAGWTLARPGSREMSERQTKEISDPASVGLRVESGTAADGSPYLYVVANPVSGPGERGKLLREQLTADGEILPVYGFSNATVVLLHGRNSSKERILGVAERFAAAGFRCLIPEVPGHGDHPIGACGYGAGKGEAEIAKAVCDDAVRRFHIPEGEARVLWGMSMGASFAVYSAAKDPDYWSAVILVAGFANLDDVLTAELTRWAGPAMPVARAIARKVAVAVGGKDPVSVVPEKAARKVSAPVFIVHGSDDAFVPLSQGERMRDALCVRDKSWLPVVGANHWNLLVTKQPVYAPMIRWARTKASVQAQAAR